MNWVSIDFGNSYSSASIVVNNKPVKVRPLGGLYDMYGFPTVAYVDKMRQLGFAMMHCLGVVKILNVLFKISS